jgi:hypothetical protein
MAETNKLRTGIVFGIVIFCLFSLWVLSPNPDHLSTPKQDESTLCNTDTYNKGQWVNQDIGITGQSIEAIEKQAGYHCPWDFAHRCFRREKENGEFNRSKAM